MQRAVRRTVLLGLCWLALLASAAARAECGGTTQCIGVGPTEAAALLAHHGNGPDTYTLGFGNQPIQTTSTSQNVFVAAVTGPVGTAAQLGSITITGANAGEFSVAGGTCLASGPVHGGSSCTIAIAFKPASVGSKSATLNVPVDPPGCVGCITGRFVTLAGTATAALPTATPTTLTVQASTPTTLDLAAIIGGTGTLSVRITAPPSHGTTSVAGTRVTYTPAAGYLGPDAFSYDVTGDTGTSPPAVVTVSVLARPDPAADAAVVGLVRAQTQTARRFARAQVANLTARLESLHQRPGSGLAPARLGPTVREEIRAQQNQSDALGSGLTDNRKRPHDGALLPASLTGNLISAVTTRSLNLSASSDRGASTSSRGATSLWVGGNIHFGGRDQTSDANALRFSTEGLSAGVDHRFGANLALGASIGYARDKTDLGDDGSSSRATGKSIALYGSYQPSGNTFVDGVLGYGSLDFDNARFVAAASDFARGERKGRQWFGSIAAGYEHYAEGLLLSPYGRLDFGRARLDAYTETGAGLAALTYFEQTSPALQFALGLRAESVHEADFGWVMPRLRLEFRHDFKRERDATLAYADLPAGPIYTIPSSTERRNSLVLGLGSDFILRGGTTLGLDYQVQRLSGIERSQAVRLWLRQDLDGKSFAPGPLAGSLRADRVRVDAGVNWDSNLNRASLEGDRLADRAYSLNVGAGWQRLLSENSRAVMSAFVSGDKFARYPGLDRFSAGGQVELQYRASADFTAPTLGVFGRVALDEHAGQLRSGQRYALGLTYRQSLTDRIDLLGALATNSRHAEHTVFDGRDSSARVSFDYALSSRSTLYLGGEYRRGDTVTTVPNTPGYATVVKSFVQDDAYGSEPRFAYRFDAKTTIWTLGFNRTLGARDAIDLSLRRADSQALITPTGIYAGQTKYVSDQFSIAYLMRF